MTRECSSSSSWRPRLKILPARPASAGCPRGRNRRLAFSRLHRLPVLARNKSELKFDPLKEVKCFDDLKKFPPFEDEWLRGGPVRRWVPKALGRQADLRLRDRRHDRHSQEPHRGRRLPHRLRAVQRHAAGEVFSQGLELADARPSGPRRLRLAVEHLAQYRGGICFCIDLDPRWVIKLIKKGWMEHLEAYKEHCIDQAMTILGAGHDIKCMFTTPKLLEALCLALGEARQDARARPASPASSPAAPSSRRSGRGSASRSCSAPAGRERHLHDADLRQHADGPGLLASPSPPPTATRSATTPRSRGPWSRSSTSTTTDQVVGYGETAA